MAATALRWAGYLGLGLALGAVIWAVAGQQGPVEPKLVMGVAMTIGVVLGFALRRKLRRG